MRISRGFGIAALVGVTAFGFASSARAEDKAQEIVIKFATLAPDGSSWMKLMKSNASELAKEALTVTGGKFTVKIKFFAGGSAGDEKDVIRKIRGGQLDGAAVTSVGLGMIQPEVRVQELPGLLEAGNNKQLDCLRTKMAPDMEKKFLDKGYVLLGWGDVGPVHIFSNVKFDKLEDLKKGKFWAWTDDDIIRQFIKEMKLNGEPLGVPGVLPALQTGKIDAIYSSPLATVALQWYTKVKYMSKEPIGVAVGAVIMRKESFDKLPPEIQELMRKKGKELEKKLKDVVRKDNDKAIKAMTKGNAIEIVSIPPDLMKEIRRAGDAVAEALTDKLYSKDMLKRTRESAKGCK